MDKISHSSLPMLAVLGFVAVIHGVWWLVGNPPAELAGFADGDSYLRLLRIERLLETRDWFDITIADVNAPYGATLHWTRLFDLVLLGLALPLMPFLGWVKALFWAGMFVSPIIHIISAGVLVWALSPLLGRKAACLTGALTVAQAGILAFSTFGHADHHMMFVLLTAMALGLVSRLLIYGDNIRRNSLLLGAVLAAGIWVGPEYLVLTGLCIGVTGLRWVAGGGVSVRINTGIALGLALSLTITTLIERGPLGFMHVEYDRLSIVHVVFGGMLAVFWCVVSGLGDRLSTPWARLLIAIIGATVLGGVMVTLFPTVIANPLNAADPAILPIYAMISEYQAVADPARFLIYFGSGLFVVPWVIWRLWQIWGHPAFWMWLLLSIALLIYLGFAVMWLRWSLYAGLFMAVVLADFVSAADDWISNRYAFSARVPVKVTALLAVIIGPMVAGTVMLQANKTPEEHAASDNPVCSVSVLSAHLSTIPEPMTIVASANFGAEIVYRTNHRVLATVHHRNADGILDGYRILTGTDGEAIRAALATRKVSAIVLCPDTSNDAYFLLEGEDQSLYQRLLRGEEPDFISAMPLPDDLSSEFRLYQVSGSSQ